MSALDACLGWRTDADSEVGDGAAPATNFVLTTRDYLLGREEKIEHHTKLDSTLIRMVELSEDRYVLRS